MQIVLYDANVLYPAPLRDLLMQLAFEEIIQAHWTKEIHEEWIRNIIQNRSDLNLKSMQAVAELMNSSVEGALLQGFEALILNLTLPDPDDRHVLAASIHGKVQKIITNNLKDFPASHLEPYELVAQSPDEFILELLETNNQQVLSALRNVQSRLRKPPVPMPIYYRRSSKWA